MNFLLIFFCLAAGYLLRRTGTLPSDAHISINGWILYIALPAVALHYIPTIAWTTDVILPLAMPLLVFAGSWIIISFLSKRFQWEKETQGALILTAGLGNTSFIGFPLTQAYFGAEGLHVAVLCDQMTFITLSTLGVLLVMHASGREQVGPALLLKRILLFPPFIGFAAAIGLPFVVDLAPVDPLFEKLSVTLIPLALFSVGMQLRFSDWRKDVKVLAVGLGYKLFVAPAIVLAVAAVFSISGMIARVSVLEASMPPMITSAILATEYQLNPPLANRMVCFGIMLSFITTFIWWAISSRIL